MSATSTHIEELEKQLDVENERIIQLLGDKFALQAENKRLHETNKKLFDENVKLREFVEFCAEATKIKNIHGTLVPIPAHTEVAMWYNAVQLMKEFA